MKNLSLRMRLFIMAGVLNLTAFVVGGVGYWASHSISEAYNKIDDISLPKTRDIMEMNLTYRLARLEYFNLLLPDISEAEQKKSIDKINESWAKYYEMLAKYKESPFLPEEEAMYNEFKSKADVVKNDFTKVMDLYSKNNKPDSAERKEIVRIIKEEMRPHGLEYRTITDKLIKFHKESAAQFSAEADRVEKIGFNLVLFSLIGSVLIGVGFAFYLSQSLVGVFTKLSQALYHSSDEVNSASRQIADASQELSQAVTEQAASLQETSASIEEMSSMVAKNSDNAKSAASVSSDSQTSAEKGKQVVEQMIHSMEAINESNNNIMDQINHSNSEIESIVKVIEEIGTKTKVINEIVFQTKLLSFNASVEAARAGEHGKGFAVVAEEVGNLAQMSGNAAKEITTLLDGSIQRVESIVRDTKSKVEVLIEDGRSKVQAGNEVAKQCGEVLNEIVTNVSSVTMMAGEISAASQEQATGVREITKAISQLDQVTQQNAATSEQAASSAEKLSSQASELKKAVDELVLTVQGRNSNATNRAEFHDQSVNSMNAKVNDQPKEVKKVNKTTKSNLSPQANSNVLPMKKSTKKPVVEEDHLSQQVQHAAAATKLAAGDGTTPSHVHPGFKDV